jgi:hypothetical protein
LLHQILRQGKQHLSGLPLTGLNSDSLLTALCLSTFSACCTAATLELPQDVSAIEGEAISSSEPRQMPQEEDAWRNLLPRQIGLGFNAYTETLNDKQLMHLEGQELALRWTADPEQEAMRDWWWIVDFQIGQQNYSSYYSGRLSAVPNIQSRWQLSRKLSLGQPEQFFIQPGITFETTWNDLNGKSTLNQSGYLRTNVALWATLGLEHVNYQESGFSGLWRSMHYEVGILLKGIQTSYLSQVSTLLPDVNNTQKEGYYLEYSVNLRFLPGWTLRPYIRHTMIEKSDVVDGVYFEPKNERTQFGLLVGF